MVLRRETGALPVLFAHGAIHLALGVALGDGVALVIGLFALAQTQLHLHAAVLEVDRQRNERIAYDWNCLRVRTLHGTYCFGRSNPIHHRHHNIHENNIKSFLGGCFKFMYRLKSIGYRFYQCTTVF